MSEAGRELVEALRDERGIASTSAESACLCELARRLARTR